MREIAHHVGDGKSSSTLFEWTGKLCRSKMSASALIQTIFSAHGNVKEKGSVVLYMMKIWGLTVDEIHAYVISKLP